MKIKTLKYFKIFACILFIFGQFVLITSCDKEETPEANTKTPTTNTNNNNDTTKSNANVNTLVFNSSKNYGTVTDADGNSYKTILIGNQTWMAENLKVSKYGNGDAIGTTSTPDQNITGDSEPKYQWLYNGNDSNLVNYGRLYTFYAITDSRGVCPTGWHVPTETEFTTLINNLGGDTAAGGKMKEVGFSHWAIPNLAATNESGLTMVPGGFKNDFGTFSDKTTNSYFWTSSSKNATNAYRIFLSNNDPGAYGGYVSKQNGYSVRCIKH